MSGWCRAGVILSIVLNKHNSAACQYFGASDSRASVQRIGNKLKKSGYRSGQAVRPAGRRSEVAAEPRANEAAGGAGGESRRGRREAAGESGERGARGGGGRGATKPRPEPRRPDAEDGGGTKLPR